MVFQPWDTWEIVRDSIDPGDPPSPAIQAELAPLAAPLSAGVLGRGEPERDVLSRRTHLAVVNVFPKAMQSNCRVTEKRFFIGGVRRRDIAAVHSSVSERERS
jgi:hypothetical protein